MKIDHNDQEKSEYNQAEGKTKRIISKLKISCAARLNICTAPDNPVKCENCSIFKESMELFGADLT